MAWVVGILGFVAGFSLGLLILMKMLKGRSKNDLISNKKLHWTYGVMTWVIAGLGAYAAVRVYEVYFVMAPSLPSS